MELKENIKYVKRPNKSFIFSTKEGDLFELNEIGAVIIDKLKEGLSIEEIVNFIQKKTDEQESIIQQDVSDFLTQLKEKNFLK